MARGRPAFDAHLLRPSGALLGAQLALGSAIERCAMDGLDHDPTTVDLLLRLYLEPENRLRAVDLCQQLVKSPSHISRILDRAEQAGLVSRSPDPGDRRASLVTLTDDGRAVVERFGPRLTAVLDHTIHRTLDPEEIDTLVELLERIEVAARSCPVPGATL